MEQTKTKTTATRVDRYYFPLNPYKADATKAAKLSDCRYDAVFFDLDGTLVETIPHICASYQRTYARFALPVPTDEEVMACIGLPLRDVVRETVPAPLVADFLSAYRRYNEAHMLESCAVFWQAYHLLNALRDCAVPMVIVTAKNEPTMRQNLGNCDLTPFFDICISSQDTKAHKPNPEPLILAAGKLGEKLGRSFGLGRCLYVGDSRYDVACAKNAGCAAALVAWTHMPLEPINAAGPYFILRQPAELGRNAVSSP